jgi:ribosomal-protein-alanine N-acetyltransferase
VVKNYNEVLYTNKRIETRRLVLRRIKPEDAEDILEYASDAKALEYQAWGGLSTLAEVQALIFDNYLPKLSNILWAIELKETGKMIGTFDLQPNPDHDCIGVGYMLNRRFWGSGYATEALSAMVALCFECLGVNRVGGIYYAGNEASGRVMEKVGMAYEGVSLQEVKIKGIYRDVVRYGIIRSAYFSRRDEHGKKL